MKSLEKKYSIVAFIDILGYKELILKESIERETELFADLKETIDFALSCAVYSIKDSVSSLDNKYENQERFATKLNVKQFSDNVYFSFDYSNDDKIDLYFGIYIITTISYLYQRLMLGKGYFVRGGIANGLNMVDKNFIFSTALIKAVEMEKETVYPRITMHQEIRDIFIEAKDNPFRELAHGQLIEDWAEQVFINPFQNYEQRIQRELELLPEEDALHLFQNITKKQQRIINKLNKKFADFFDNKKFNSLCRKIISDRIKKYKNKQQKIYEKYLWTRNLLNWIDGKPTEITFKLL